MIHTARWQLVLLDVGGVLVDVDHARARRVWRRRIGRSPDDFDALFAEGRKADFDCGRMSPSTFFGETAAQLGDPRLAAPLEEAFRAMIRPRTGLAPALRQLRGRVPLGLLSNIDPVHHDVVAAVAEFRGLFEPAVLSFRIGACKPDPAAFRSALGAAGDPPPEAVVFLDDRQENVAAARKLGIAAERVDSEAGVLHRLRELGGVG